jgi:hypothetical protein
MRCIISRPAIVSQKGDDPRVVLGQGLVEAKDVQEGDNDLGTGYSVRQERKWNGREEDEGWLDDRDDERNAEACSYVLLPVDGCTRRRSGIMTSSVSFGRQDNSLASI